MNIVLVLSLAILGLPGPQGGRWRAAGRAARTLPGKVPRGQGLRVRTRGRTLVVRLGRGRPAIWNLSGQPREVRWTRGGVASSGPRLVLWRLHGSWYGRRWLGRKRGWSRVAVRRVDVSGSPVFVFRSTNWGAVARPAGGHGLVVVWSGRLGPLGPDGEVVRRLEVSPGRVVVFLQPAGFRRCDGGPVRLFPRAYHPGKGRFLPVSFRPDVNAYPVILARPGLPAWVRPWDLSPLRFVFASSRAGAGRDPGRLGLPRSLQDHRVDTAWTSGPFPVGTFLQAVGVAWPYGILGIRFVPGDARSAETLRSHGRLRRFLLALGSYRFVVELTRDPAELPPGTEFWAALPQPVRARCGVVTVLDVYPGKGSRDVGVAEFHFVTELDRPGGLWRLAQDVASGRVPASAALVVIRRAGRRLAAPILDALGRARGGAARLLARWYLEVGGRPEALFAVFASLPEQVRVVVVEQAARHMGSAVLGRLPRRASWRVRLGLLRGLAHSGHVGREAARLLAWFGHGPETFRLALVSALEHVPCRYLGQRALLEGRDGVADRIWTAGLRVRAGVCGGVETLKALERMEWRKLGFPERFRYLQALGWSLAGSARASAIRFLERVARNSSEEVLRWVATRMLGYVGRVAALHDRLEDEDPRVRWAALEALQEHGDPRWPSAALACVLSDPWPWLRRRCSRLVAAHCPKGAGPALARAFAKRGVSEGMEVLAVLSRCRYKEAWPAVEALVRNWRRRPARAAAVIGYLAGARRGLELVARVLAGAAKLARPHGNMEMLAVRAAVALGEWGGAARSAAWAIVAGLASPSASVRRAAVETAWRVCGGPGDRLVPDVPLERAVRLARRLCRGARRSRGSSSGGRR